MKKYHQVPFLVMAICLIIAALPSGAQSIYHTDFNKLNSWQEEYSEKDQWKGFSATSSIAAVQAKASLGQFGTVDVCNTTYPSEGLLLSVKNTAAGNAWNASLNSGLIAVKNTETNLAKLTVSFDHSISSVRPVTLKIESYDASKKRTGGLQKTVYPATTNHFLHSSFELSDMKASGEGSFNSRDPYIQVAVSIEGDNRDDSLKLKFDNFSYAAPAYYVSATGNNKNDGRTEKTAFADPQAALDKAKPGDIILLMNGDYSKAVVKENKSAVAHFMRAGAPDAWVTLKNYPGHKPTIHCKGNDGIRMGLGSRYTTTESPLLSYLEIRGLHVRGNSDEVPKLYPKEIGYATPNTETKGIYVTARFAPTRMYHHLRIADCLVEYCGTDGIFVSAVDYLTLENNIIRNNCWTTVDFAMAGFSCMMYADFDKIDNVTKILVRNNQVYGNQRKTIKKEGTPKIFNGNGMLFDANAEKYLAPDAYYGRTLIQNNLVYGNGGGGIQNWGSHRLDIVNNTLYHNGISPDLKWGNLGFDFCKDIRLVNNIVVALPDRPLDYWLLHQADRDTSMIVRINNLYYGGVKPNIKGEQDIVADPLFVNASLDPSVADFRLKPGSPAIGSGYNKIESIPIVDVMDKNRPSSDKIVSRGAYEFQ